MNTAIPGKGSTRMQPAAAAAVGMLWQTVRLPLLALLTLLEPVVRWMLTLAMMLGIFAAVAFELSAAGPQFPFLGVLALSFACAVMLLAYYALLALLSR